MINRAGLRVAIALCMAGAAMLARASLAQSSPRDGARQSVPPGLAASELLGPGGDDPLQTARACWLEATWQHADCVAIAYVLKRRAARAGVTVAEHAHAYSLRKPTARAAFARQLPDGDEPTWTPALNTRWLQLRTLAADALAGKVRNPCAGAWDWGARNLGSDVRRATSAIEAGRWRVVQCSERTANAFYAERSR